MQIGGSIQLQRIKKGLTQPRLAALSGIAQANLSNIENGKKDLNLTTLKKISYALGVPAWELVRSVEEAQTGIRLTREGLESLARAILGDKAPRPSPVSEELLAALRGVFSPRRGVSDRALEKDWAEVSRFFSKKDLEAIRLRVNDERARRL
jgi:transcriptional regulator with XRE-family HTH domain